MQVIVPSRGRADTIAVHTLRWFPSAIVCVDEREVDDYGGLGCEVLPHPPLPHLPAILNWILACPGISGDRIAIVDDDLKHVQAIATKPPRKITDPRDVWQIVENCRTMAEGFGTRLWGFSVNRRPDSNYAYRPFSLNARVGSFRGISDRSIRFDESFLRHDDCDLCLTELMQSRIVFRDDRFNFIFRPVYQTDGWSAEDYEETAQTEEEIALKRKWGKYIYFVRSPHHWNETRINVQR